MRQFFGRGRNPKSGFLPEVDQKIAALVNNLAEKFRDFFFQKIISLNKIFRRKFLASERGKTFVFGRILNWVIRAGMVTLVMQLNLSAGSGPFGDQ